MGDPPQLDVKIPQTRDLPPNAHKFNENFFIDFLLLTAVDCEFLSCFHYLQEPLKYYKKEIGFVYVGKMGDETEQEKLTIGLMKCNKGNLTGGAAMTVQNAVTTLKPKGVLCVGFCGGMNADKAKLGDVVVSTNLISYALQTVTEDGIEPRGTIVPLNKKLNDIMRYADNGWVPPLKNMTEAGPKVALGMMLSGPVLVNSKYERDRLRKQYPSAIAIEMEGEGVYTAAHNLEIEWVVVKGISDYADGSKDSTKDWKPYASVMAASLVAHVLRQPSVFEDWPRYGGESSAERSRTSAGPTMRERGSDSQGSPDQSPAGPSKDCRKDSVKDGQVSNNDVYELGNQLGLDWMKLGQQLEVNDIVLQDLQTNIQLYHDLSAKACEMLKKWRSSKPDSATYQVLYEALCHKHVSRKDLAQEICCHQSN